ncbi:MAG: hypothetical protein V4723_16390 [Pseudomonadota bacterium]
MNAGASKRLQLHAWLRETAWYDLLGIGLVMMVVVSLATLGAERGSLRAGLRLLPLLALAFLLLGKLAVVGYGGLRRRRAAAHLSWGEQLVALAPLGLLAWIRTDRANLRSCLAWILRRPHPAPAIGRTLSTQGKSIYGTVFAMVIFSTFVDLPLNVFIVTVMVKDPQIQLIVHAVCLVLAAYTLMWILGDRHALAGSAHVLGESALHLRVGNRLSADIDFTAIVRAEAISISAAVWRAQHSVWRSRTMRATPVDPPNLVLQLDMDAGVRLTKWQVEQPAAEYLFLYLDQPSVLVALIADRQKGLSCPHV